METGDALRYGRRANDGPSHLLHYSEDKKPIVVWNITQSCNLHCGHCYANSKDIEYEGELNTEEGLALIDDVADFGAPVLLFSGGEPIKRPDLFELAAAARDKGLRTVISTNGTLIDEAIAERLKDVGLSYVGISFDGIGALHDKMRGKHGAFDDALRGIRTAKAAGLKVGVRFTLHGLNRQHLGEVFDLAEREEVDRLCVYHLAYAGRGELIKQFDLDPGQTSAAVNEIFDRTADFVDRGIEVEVLTVDNPVDNIALLGRLREVAPERADDVEKLLQWNGGNQSGIAVSCVDPKGNVHPDQFSWHINLGNVREKRFAEIWSDSNPALAPYRKRPREIAGRCTKCSWYDVCNGGLRVRAETPEGSFEGPDPACYLHTVDAAYTSFAAHSVEAAV